jgi:predicted DCC family thiol-disulfide oxidoreductase YuxK
MHLMSPVKTESRNSTLPGYKDLQENRSPVVLFDGVCNLCNKTVQFILQHDKMQAFTFSCLQSDFGRLVTADSGLGGQFPDSVILYENGQLYTRSCAIIRIAEILGGYSVLTAGLHIIPKGIRDAVYNFVARHRYRWFGKSDHCMIPDPELSGRFLP